MSFSLPMNEFIWPVAAAVAGAILIIIFKRILKVPPEGPIIIVPPPVPEQPTSKPAPLVAPEEEAHLWLEVKKSGARNNYVFYLRRYPLGFFAAEAENYIWGEAGQNNTIAAYEAFLADVPQGKKRALAEFRIRMIREEEERRSIADNADLVTSVAIAAEPETPSQQLVRAAPVAQNAVMRIGDLQLEFWKRFREQLLEQRILNNDPEQPRGVNYFNVRCLDHPLIWLECRTLVNKEKIELRVYIRPDAPKALPQLEAHRREIEDKIGERLTWGAYPDAVPDSIALDREANLRNREKWNEYILWLVRHVRSFKEAFYPHVQNLR